MQRYYVHDTTRGFVGNSMIWWAKGHRGYTTDPSQAHEFTFEELSGMDDDLVAYPVERVQALHELHVTKRHELKGFGVRLGFEGRSPGQNLEE